MRSDEAAGKPGSDVVDHPVPTIHPRGCVVETQDAGQDDHAFDAY
jgi:hypothetical protein